MRKRVWAACGPAGAGGQGEVDGRSGSPVPTPIPVSIPVSIPIWIPIPTSVAPSFST
jgi:hypothetical protein